MSFVALAALALTAQSSENFTNPNLSFCDTILALPHFPDDGSQPATGYTLKLEIYTNAKEEEFVTRLIDGLNDREDDFRGAQLTVASLPLNYWERIVIAHGALFPDSKLRSDFFSKKICSELNFRGRIVQFTVSSGSDIRGFIDWDFDRELSNFLLIVTSPDAQTH